MSDIAQIPVKENPIPGATTRMGRLLVESGKISADGLKAIIGAQQERGLRFGDAALMLGLVTEEDISAVLAEQFSYTAAPDESTKLDARLVAVFRPGSTQAEALRSLRSELLLRYFKQDHHQTLALVGAEDPQSIALMAANLAIAFAQLGIRTLLVDGNLRNPQLHSLFGRSNRHPGLADLVAERARVQPVAIPSLRSLWLVQAGTQAPNPQELLASKHYSQRMHELTRSFDVTLISTAPLNSNRDAQLIAAQAGAALIVAQEQVSRMKELEKICTSLRSLNIHLVGLALRQ